MLEQTKSRAKQGVAEGYRHLSIYWAIVFLLLLDVACVVISMSLAYRVRFEWLPYRSDFLKDFYVHLTWVAIPLWGLIFVAHRLYNPEHLFGGLQEYASAASACTVGTLALVLYSFISRRFDQDISRGWLAMVWLFSLVSVSWARFGFRRVIYYLRRRGIFTSRVVVVGANEEGRMVMDQLADSPAAGLQVIGFVDPALSAGTTVGQTPVVGNLNSLDRLIDEMEVDELIVIPTALERDELLDLYRDLGTDGRVSIRLSSGLYELFTTGVQVKEVGSIPLVKLNRTRITGLDAVMKSALNYLGATVGLVLLAPVYGVIALLVRLDSPGPIIYRRRVVGLYGREFDAYKFRTMIVGADAYLEAHPELKAEWEETGKIQDDPRITRIGRVLRVFSLDELPQLVNVLKGEMSLVGPRMITPGELDHFGRWRYNLLTVKPGLTGLWQVSGRSDLSYEERVRLDMYYIRNYSIWLDLRILFNTFWALLKRQGAY